MYLYRSSSPSSWPLPARRRGLGAVPTSQTAAQIASAGASTTAAILVSLGTIGGPVGLAIAGLAAIAPLIVSLFHGCGQLCIQAANLDNQAVLLLWQNLNAYLSSPVRTFSMRAAALNNFDTLWSSYVQAEASVPTQGQISITERQRGGVSKWACQSPAATRVRSSCQGAPPCCSGVDWFVMYRDPIANDPGVQPDPVPGGLPAATSGALFSSVGVNPSTQIFGIPISNLLLPGGLLLAFVLLSGNSSKKK
jgi:hypothetical protein